MGAALLSNQDNACNIIRNLSSNLSIPGKDIMFARCLLMDSFCKDSIVRDNWSHNLLYAKITRSWSCSHYRYALSGCICLRVLVHLRTKTTSSNSPANWDALAALVQSVSIPVIANGDVYTMADVEYLVQTTGCAGAMIGRVCFIIAPCLMFQ